MGAEQPEGEAGLTGEVVLLESTFARLTASLDTSQDMLGSDSSLCTNPPPPPRVFFKNRFHNALSMAYEVFVHLLHWGLCFLGFPFVTSDYTTYRWN